jgi:glycosyltransferase involved in cell wall biosynthesis
MDKLLIITPHLSTGGLPQFLLDKIQILIKEYDVYLVEWENITGGVFVVQRNKLVELVKDKFYTIGENKNEILNLITKIQPNIIHFEEFSETFISESILKNIYENKKYFITETTHGTSFDVNDKCFIPDKIMFVSKGNFNQYRTITDSEVIEYPSRLQKRHQGLKKLGLDTNFKHVLNVGLFTSGKNQAEIFEIAKNMLQYKIQFHFVGNQASNFENYWRPLMINKPENCHVWGEKENVEDFYKSMDLFLYTSRWENRPLSVLEALNYDMKVLMYNLENYGDTFANNSDVNFLTNDIQTNISIILESLNVEKNEEIKKSKNIIYEKKEIESKKNINAYHMLTDIDSDREVQSLISLSKLRNLGINYQTCINKRWTKLPPSENCQYPDKISMEPGGKLTPGHYGCYLAHKGAFYKGLQDNPDYILIFECDAVIDVDYEEFKNKLRFACNVLENREDLLMFSFGFHNHSNIIEQKSEYWVVNRFYGAHAYLIPRKSYQIIDNMYKKSKWNVTDLLFAENLDMYKTGIFEIPITKQAAGLSILDKVHHEERY